MRLLVLCSLGLMAVAVACGGQSREERVREQVEVIIAKMLEDDSTCSAFRRESPEGDWTPDYDYRWWLSDDLLAGVSREDRTTVTDRVTKGLFDRCRGPSEP